MLQVALILVLVKWLRSESISRGFGVTILLWTAWTSPASALFMFTVAAEGLF